MNKYQEIILKLKTKGVEFDSPLSIMEIERIEAFYGLNFPMELKHLFTFGLPISNGFYNWRDMSDNNAENIKKILQRPLLGIQADLEEDYQDNDYYGDDIWCDKWGEKPDSYDAAYEILLSHYMNAPKLVPIYLHRYMPFIPNSKETPVFSIVGSDIICYGENLISYLETEFKIKGYDSNMCCKYVDFWSDLL